MLTLQYSFVKVSITTNEHYSSEQSIIYLKQSYERVEGASSTRTKCYRFQPFSDTNHASRSRVAERRGVISFTIIIIGVMSSRGGPAPPRMSITES